MNARSILVTCCVVAATSGSSRAQDGGNCLYYTVDPPNNYGVADMQDYFDAEFVYQEQIAETCRILAETQTKTAEMNIFRKHVDALKNAVDDLDAHVDVAILQPVTSLAVEFQQLLQSQVTWWASAAAAAEVARPALNATDLASYQAAHAAISTFEQAAKAFDDSGEIRFLDETAKLQQQILATKQAVTLLRGSDNFADLSVTRDSADVAEAMGSMDADLTALYGQVAEEREIVQQQRIDRIRAVDALTRTLEQVAERALQRSNVEHAWEIVASIDATYDAISLTTMVQTGISGRTRRINSMTGIYSCPRLAKRENYAAATWTRMMQANLPDNLSAPARTLLEDLLDVALERFTDASYIEFLNGRLDGYFRRRVRLASSVVDNDRYDATCQDLAREVLRHQDGIESEIAFRRLRDRC